MFKKIGASFSAFVENAPINEREKNRLRQYSIFVFISIPAMIIFGFSNGVQGRLLICGIILVSGVGLVLGWYLLGRIKNGAPVYYLNMVCYCILLQFIFMEGGESGSMILWGYTLPLIAFFLFGKRGGIFWSSLVLAGFIFISINPFNWPNVYEYHSEVILRYVAVYIIVSIITCWFEYLRQRYREGIEKKNSELREKHRLLIAQVAERIKAEKDNDKLIRELQEALESVEQLKGFLPICASCRKIRDDQGYWNQIDTYLRTHSELKFSHSICPECTKKLYPGVEIAESSCDTKTRLSGKSDGSLSGFLKGSGDFIHQVKDGTVRDPSVQGEPDLAQVLLVK